VRYLLDTHILLWWLADSSDLTKSARETISKRENFVMVSAASIWEIRIKQGIGKIQLPPDFEVIVAEAPFEHLSITSRHAHAVFELPLLHRDPFDRLLIAQAQCENLTLLTHDRNLAVYDVGVAF